MALVSPKTTVQTCLHKCLHYWGIDGWAPAPWTALRSHRSWEKRQSYRFTLEPGEKRADSQVLVLGFSQAPLSTSCMPQPLGPNPFLPCSLQYQHADTFTTGFGFAGLKTNGLRVH